MRKLFTFIAVFTAFAASLLGQAGQGSPTRGTAGQNESRPPSGEVRPGPRPPFRRWWAVEKNKQELKLTAEQVVRLDKIYSSAMDRMKAQKDDLDRAQLDFSQLMRNTASERDRLRAADSLELARFKLSSERTSMLVRLHGVLTPEQDRVLQAIFRRNDDERNKNNDNNNNNRSR